MERLIELLANSSNRSEKKLAKQIVSFLQKPSSGKKYRLEQKLYITFLNHIDDLTSMKLLEIEHKLTKIRDYIIRNSGWTFNRNEAYSQDFVFQEFDEKDDPYLFYLVRDINGFHTRTNRPSTPYKRAIRDEERRFLLQFGVYLTDAHDLMKEKDNILFNRLFTIKPNSEELVNLILISLKEDYTVKNPILDEEQKQQNKKGL